MKRLLINYVAILTTKKDKRHFLNPIFVFLYGCEDKNTLQL